MLSKSSCLVGKQCLKRLYLEHKHRELLPEITQARQHVFEQGHRVGELALQLFPNGTDATPPRYNSDGIQHAIQHTLDLIHAGERVIYEAAFVYNQVFCAVDILVLYNDEWEIFEVKSSTQVKEVNIDDIAVQLYVLQGNGLIIGDASVVHINTVYQRDGSLNPQQLFRRSSVLEAARGKQHEVSERIAEMKAVLKSEEVPAIDIGLHCHEPYECPFIPHCRQHLPAYSVFDLGGIWRSKAYERYYEGDIDILSLPEDEFNQGQAAQIRLAKDGSTLIDRESIRSFFNDLHYPLFFFDVETWNPAIPPFDKTRPFEQHIFQYSLHVQEAPGSELIHKAFLANPDGSDYRHELIQQLLADIGTQGDVVVYNMGFEHSRIGELTHHFPEFTNELLSINKRMIDLMEVFKNGWYRSPELRGSYSIKAVLPVLVPELTYKNLDIQSGDVASALFNAAFFSADHSVFDSKRQALLDYCGLDTVAMVEIVERLQML
ncbi:MAG: DUF2779 domain-containing protein [Flavobacteriales bacterium]